MIINIRGTSGSGKSTIVRAIMELCESCEPVHTNGRRQPLYYICRNPRRGHDLAVIGHYETACGGCDTITKQDHIVELVREQASLRRDVLFEGLLMSGEVRRTVDIHAHGYRMQVVELDVPIDICVTSVNARRWKKNPDKPPVNPKNTIAKFKTVKNVMRRLKEAGIPCYTLGREEALEHIKGKFNL